jgi:sigma-54 dependent transcriptional regulator, flagellar regulatory protein
MNRTDDSAFAADDEVMLPLPRRILLFAGASERAVRLDAILEFLECEPLLQRSIPDPDRDGDQNWLAWVVSSCLGQSLADLLNDLPALAPGIPVLLIGDEDEFPVLTPAARAQVVRRVSFPVRYPEISEALRTARHAVANGGLVRSARELELFRPWWAEARDRTGPAIGHPGRGNGCQRVDSWRDRHRQGSGRAATFTIPRTGATSRSSP